jgi:hypothetical protein
MRVASTQPCLPLVSRLPPTHPDMLSSHALFSRQAFRHSVVPAPLSAQRAQRSTETPLPLVGNYVLDPFCIRQWAFVSLSQIRILVFLTFCVFPLPYPLHPLLSGTSLLFPCPASQHKFIRTRINFNSQRNHTLLNSILQLLSDEQRF